MQIVQFGKNCLAMKHWDKKEREKDNAWMIIGFKKKALFGTLGILGVMYLIHWTSIVTERIIFHLLN